MIGLVCHMSEIPKREVDFEGKVLIFDWAFTLPLSDFHHESTPHLLLDTKSVYIIHFVLVGDWFVQETTNTVGKGCDADVSHHLFGRALCDVPKDSCKGDT